MIGKVIAHLLKENAALLALVNTDNIFPYVMNVNTELPAIIYSVDSVSTEYNKDGWVSDICTFSVSSFSADYASLQNIITQVRTALDFKDGTAHSITYHHIYLTGQVEGYSVTEDVFMNKLTFEVKVIQYL